MPNETSNKPYVIKGNNPGILFLADLKSKTKQHEVYAM